MCTGCRCSVNDLGIVKQGADEPTYLSFREGVKRATDAGLLDGSVKFYLAGETLPKQVRKLDTVSSSRKTNGSNKSDEDACFWALQSALATLQNAAKIAAFCCLPRSHRQTAAESGALAWPRLHLQPAAMQLGQVVGQLSTEVVSGGDVGIPLLEDGRAYGKLDAVAGILEKLGAGWRLTGYSSRY